MEDPPYSAYGCGASAAEIRSAVITLLTQQTFRNRLLEEQLLAKHLVACIPLTPTHCCLRRQLCQARNHWMMEFRSVVFFEENRLCLGASNGHVLVRRSQGERLQRNCLRRRHTGQTLGVIVWGAISYGSRSTLVVIPNTLITNLYFSLVLKTIVLRFMNSIQGEVFQQDNTRPHTTVVMQHAPQSVDMLPCLPRSSDLSLLSTYGIPLIDNSSVIHSQN
ncbi:transposable element Tc1 transposase [Trichonephila clavipes]|nr:transposable element Tc1 transposase [Trichonephila clavipes]